ncbi:MAG: hypothetical protein AAF467_04820 [Actinomycetota bacterium]
MSEPTPAPAVGGALAPWDRRELPSAFTVLETARRVGHYKWLEMRLFELLGTWVAVTPELEIKYRLGVHCYHHSAHAELWHRRLPELADVNPEQLTAPPNPETERLLEQMVPDPWAPDLTIERLVALYRVVLPHLIGAYTFHLNNTSQMADAPTIRSLRICLQDDMEEWREGEMMLQTLVRDDEDIERATRHQGEVTRLLVAAGGVIGPGSLGPVD